MDRLADALITARPPAPTATASTQAADPDLERRVMGHLIATEVDRVMSVHRAYLSDLARRSRVNNRMCKHLKRDIKRSNKKLKRANTGTENNVGNHDDSETDSDSSSDSSSSSEEE